MAAWCGLDGMRLIVGDKCLGMLEAVYEVFPEAKYQCCTVHFYRNVFSVVPRSKIKVVAKMLKAIHAQESKAASREKAEAVVKSLLEMKLDKAAKKVEIRIGEGFVNAILHLFGGLETVPEIVETSMSVS